MDLSLPNDFESAFLNDWGNFGENNVVVVGGDVNDNNSSVVPQQQPQDNTIPANRNNNSISSNSKSNNNNITHNNISSSDSNNNIKSNNNQQSYVTAPLMMETGDRSLAQYWHTSNLNSFETDLNQSNIHNNTTEVSISLAPSTTQRDVSQKMESGEPSITPVSGNNNNNAGIGNISGGPLHQSQQINSNNNEGIKNNTTSNISLVPFQLQPQHMVQPQSNMTTLHEQQILNPQQQPQQKEDNHNQYFGNAKNLSPVVQQHHQNELFKNASLAIMKQLQPVAPSTDNNNVTASNNTQVTTQVQRQQPQCEPPPPSSSINNTNICTPAAVAPGPTDPLPPFFLFGAPAELRNNFIQTQREQKLPILEDNNSFHYGMAVNGFHPQVNAMENPPVLLDGRHLYSSSSSGNKKKEVVVQQQQQQAVPCCKERNEKEQRRAQKITELIESLRLSMVQGGWKVEMKSKFHTLSTCAEYVQHLIDTTKEKEEALEQVKSDLELRKQKREEEKALREQTNQEMSVTSSLTTSSTGSTNNSTSNTKIDNNYNSNMTTTAQVDRKRKSMSQSASRITEDNNGDRNDNRNKEVNVTQKSASASLSRRSNTINNVIRSSDGDEGDRVVMKSISIDKVRSSSVSDFTDSNMGSDQGCYTDNDHHQQHHHKKQAPQQLATAALDSICTTAAVATLRKKEAAGDIVRTNNKLNYEEVFMTSNVPQLIATTAGRIISWNKFFVRATGLSSHELRSLTIFSIVQADKLSSLFENVASVLRTAGSMSTTSPLSSSSSLSGKEEEVRENTDEINNKTSSSDNNNRTCEKSGVSNISNVNKDNTIKEDPNDKEVQMLSKITRVQHPILCLPCIQFPIQSRITRKRSRDHAIASDTKNSVKLYMAVTLMNHEDHRNRFFHCTFTNAPGKDEGSIGSITPELLVRMSDLKRRAITTKQSVS